MTSKLVRLVEIIFTMKKYSERRKCGFPINARGKVSSEFRHVFFSKSLGIFVLIENLNVFIDMMTGRKERRVDLFSFVV